MTALKGRDIERFIKAPDPQIALALVYGPEQGLVRERAKRLVEAVVPDLADPWQVTSLNDEDAGDAVRLSDEAAQQSFLGGRRVVRLRASGAQTGTAVASLLKGVEGGSFVPASLVIVEAGDLKKTAALRKVCETSPVAAAIACYPEGERDQRTAVREQCAADGLQVSDEAMEMILAAAGHDRGLLRGEVEKLVLFKGPAGEERQDPTITGEDAAACLSDSAEEDSFAVASLALDGDPSALSRALRDAEQQGSSVVGLLRQSQNRLLRLLPAAAAMARGEGVGAAIKKIKPPVFFKEDTQVRRQLERWPLARLEQALEALYRAEAACKRTGAPDRAIAERALLSLAARRKR